MIRTIATLAAGAAFAALSIAPAAAQNLPPPGNVNPGSIYSGAEQTGAPNQERSYRRFGGYYGPYAAPSYGVTVYPGTMYWSSGPRFGLYHDYGY